MSRASAFCSSMAGAFLSSKAGARGGRKAVSPVFPYSTFVYTGGLSQDQGLTYQQNWDIAHAQANDGLLSSFVEGDIADFKTNSPVAVALGRTGLIFSGIVPLYNVASLQLRSSSISFFLCYEDVVNKGVFYDPLYAAGRDIQFTMAVSPVTGGDLRNAQPIGHFTVAQIHDLMAGSIASLELTLGDTLIPGQNLSAVAFAMIVESDYNGAPLLADNTRGGVQVALFGTTGFPVDESTLEFT